MFEGIFSQSIIARAQTANLVKIKIINIRDFGQGPRKNVDDKPYGGGKGMVLRVDIVAKALKTLKPKPYLILLSASGKKYDQKMAQMFSKKQSLALICGHYEGIDARAEKFVDGVISIGDFVLSGGEIAAMAIIDSVTRLVPGVIHPKSLSSESFSQISNLLEYPQYTRPKEFQGLKVPKILLSGNHQEIEKWREQQAFKRTKKYRPGLLKKF